jgi:hypothetical protein
MLLFAVLASQRELPRKPVETLLATDTPAVRGVSQSSVTTATAASAAATAAGTRAGSEMSRAAARADVPGPEVNDSSPHPAAAALGQLPQKPVLVDWHLLLRVVKVWQIWYLACTEAVKGKAS